VKATPYARRQAAELGIDLASLTGTGADGLITLEDVRRAAGLTG
jgi:pyruvate dehydrogenase E2 component (dihydrolipoamide acetyltransferase)